MMCTPLQTIHTYIKTGGREPAFPWCGFSRSCMPPATIRMLGINHIKRDLGKVYVTLLPKMGLRAWGTHFQLPRRPGNGKRSEGQETTEVTRRIPRQGWGRKTAFKLSSPYDTAVPYPNSQHSLPNTLSSSSQTFHFTF